VALESRSFARGHVARFSELGEPPALSIRRARAILGTGRGLGISLNLHPMAFAAWFGLAGDGVETCFRIRAKLDGGHISFAVLGRRSTIVTVVMHTRGNWVLDCIFLHESGSCGRS
jgi:hypothetical protein